jgi:hypothetical protein
MGAPSPELYHLWQDFRRETKRVGSPAVIACSLVVSVAWRAKFVSHGPSCTAVAVTLLSLLAASVGSATAHELSIDRPIILASDPASQQLGQRKLADDANPPECGAPDVTARGFDLATSPPIESIDAQTDITVFLQSGVPDALRLAALRRAWTMDPAIRDFKGLQENDWNFNDPNSIPGFGELGPEIDVKRTVAEILGEAPRLALAH